MTYYGDLSYHDTINRLLNVEDPQKQALLITIYLTGSRVGEIVHYYKNTRDHIYKPPMSPTDITIETLDSGKKMMAFQVRVEKSQQNRFRKVFINLTKEKELARRIWAYRNQTLKVRLQYLWPITPHTAAQWFKQTFPEFNVSIHHLRHWRITHYLSGAVTGKPVPKDIVAKIVGHSTITTTNLYDHVPVKNYAEEL